MPLRGISSSRETSAIVSGVLEGTPQNVRAQVESLFRTAAGADAALFHLSREEAEMVRALIDAHRTPAGVDLEAASAALETRMKELLAARDPDGIRTFFSSTTPDLGQRVIDAMKETIAVANGRRVDIDVMIFAFQDKTMADQILELLEGHANVHLHMVCDFSLVTEAGGRQPARMLREAAGRGLSDRCQIKFKKDNPWIWSASAGRPVFNHSSTKGLNHHKGFVTLIEGRPHRMGTGSFNWSRTAAEDNFENLFIVDAKNQANRAMMRSFSREVVAFFNHPDTVTVDQAQAFKRDAFNALRVANGQDPLPRIDGGAPMALYVPPLPPDIVDANHLSDESWQKVEALVANRSLTRSILHQFTTYGPFTSFENLIERVPRLRDLTETRLSILRGSLEFGEGGVQINRATEGELVRALKLSPTMAKTILRERERVGDFESIEALRGLPGMTTAIFERIEPRVNDDIGRAYFSAKAISDAQPRTGYAEHDDVPVMGRDGNVTIEDATLSAAAIDLIRRARPGDVVKLAMYGLSASTPEYAEIVDAANRGVAFQIVLNKDHNEGVAAELARLRDRGLPIAVRIIRGKTMHEKFGVVNDDLFHGSANMSGSSSSKHSEDRFAVKNNAEAAAEFHAEHARLWERGTDVP
jgi:hypothetical protein